MVGEIFEETHAMLLLHVIAFPSTSHPTLEEQEYFSLRCRVGFDHFLYRHKKLRVEKRDTHTQKVRVLVRQALLD